MRLITPLLIVFAVAVIAVGVLTPRGNLQAAACPAALEPTEGFAGIDFLQFNRAVVPCGRACDDSRTAYDDEQYCTLCHLLILVKNVFDLLFAWLIMVGLLFLTISGVIYILSSGNPGMKSLAKGAITKTLTGFIVFVLSWLIVYTALVFFSADNVWGISAGDTWYTFTCDETSSPFNGVFGGGGGGGAGGGGGGGAGGGGGGGGAAGGGTYTYDPGIAAQVADESAELAALLACMDSQLPAGAKRISSISDSAGIALCSNPATYSHPPCAHTLNSCHYGGVSCAGTSYAVDFGEESFYTEIRAAALACEPGAYVLNEATHVHISVGMANGCGCN